MSGHSKWASIKHQKGAKDKARGKLFAKLIRQIEVCAREGGGDVNANATLRTMVTKAKAASVTNDTIERAIKRGTGELEGVSYEAITYEGYAPCGVAVLVEVLTDNRNRTGAEMRNMFTKNGGSMAEPGSVSWQFDRKGVLLVPRRFAEDDVLMAALEAGAEDVADGGEEWRITTEASALDAVKAALEIAGIEVTSAERPLVASTEITLATPEEAKRVLKVLDALDDHDDVQDVYSNADIPDDVLDLVEA